MADTITIDLNAKQAIDGFNALSNEIDDTEASVESLDAAGEKLSVIQQQQITLIQQQTTDWKTFTSQMTTATIPALSEVTIQALHVGLELEHIAHAGTEFALKAGLKVVTTLADMAQMTLKYTLLTKGAVDVIGAFRGKTVDATKANEENSNSLIGTAAKATALGVVVTTLTGQWESVGQAATATGSAAVKALAVIGPVAAAGSTLLIGYEAIMSRTGLVTDEFGKTTSNLDRVQKAASGLGNDIGAVFGELGSNLKKSALEAIPFYTLLSEQIPVALKYIDEEATKVAESNVRSINYMRDLINGTRQYEELHAKLDEQREKEKSGFDGLKAANATLASEEKARARAAEIASITTIEGIEKEKQAIRTKAGEMAQAGRSQADVEQYVLSNTRAVEQQRTAILNQESAKRLESERNVAAIRKEIEQNTLRGYQVAAELRVKATQESYDKEKRILEEFKTYRRDLANDARTNLFDDAEATVRARGEQAKARADLLEGDAKVKAARQADRDTEDALQTLKLRRIQEELQQKVAAAKTDEEARRAVVEAERKRINAEADFNRQRRVQQIQDETSAAMKSIGIEKGKQDALKAIIQGAKGGDGAGAFDPSAILKGTNQKDVRANLIEQAKRDAEEKFKRDNQASLTARPNYDAIKGTLVEKFDPTRVGLAMKEDERVQAENRRKYEAGLRRAQQEAARQAGKDFAKGETDPAQMAQAQADAANKTTQALVAQGKLGEDVAKVLQNQIQIAAQQQAKSETLDRQIQQLKDAQEMLIGAGNANQNRAGVGGGRN